MKDGARGGADTLEGGDGDDWIYGDGREQATAGAGGADKLYGGDGPDHLIGGSGNHLLAGGAGADQFVFAYGAGRDGRTDFVSGAEHINSNACDIADGRIRFWGIGDGTHVFTGAG